MTLLDKTILLTGAAGDIGTRIRPYLQSRYNRIVLSDLNDVFDLAENETFQKADLVDKHAMQKICQGIDGVVHLGGQSVEGDWETVNSCNIQGLVTLLEAAHHESVKRFVFASSNHAIGMYYAPDAFVWTPESDLIQDMGSPRLLAKHYVLSTPTSTESGACPFELVMWPTNLLIYVVCPCGYILKICFSSSALDWNIRLCIMKLFSAVHGTIERSGIMLPHFALAIVPNTRRRIMLSMPWRLSRRHVLI